MIGKILYVNPENDHGLVETKETATSDSPGILPISFKNIKEKQKVEKYSIVEFEIIGSKETGKIYAEFISLADDHKADVYKAYEKQLLEKKAEYEGRTATGKLLFLNPEGNDGIVDTENDDLKTLTIYFKKQDPPIKEGSIVTFEIVKAHYSGNIYAKFLSPGTCNNNDEITKGNTGFDFGNANDAQKEAISTTDGPVLITAGPGTGKTFTLVQRVLYLIENKHVKPENILIATFTEKAAKELITRITNELDRHNITANLKDMYIGTFHSICLRILKEKQEYTRLKHNYRMLDDFDQKYMVFQNIKKFREIKNIESTLRETGAWKQACAICNFANTLCEEQVLPESMIKDNNPAIVTIGKILQLYKQLLRDNNMLDFSSVQSEIYELLTTYPDILQEYRDTISYIMVDEYQDTNYIQEKLIFLLAGDRQNICVVGDDDQGLYRFRGATIRNILEFPGKFADRRCRIISLDINYRSNSDIVDFYNKWMETTKNRDFQFEWGKYRYPKKIKAQEKSRLSGPAVVKLSGNGSDSTWQKNILKFIADLKGSGRLTDYNQIAFLFNSVKTSEVKSLAAYLETNGINVYSPRSDMFFHRDEVKLTLGCLMLMFPNYVNGLNQKAYPFIQNEDYKYYSDCIQVTEKYLNTPDGQKLSAKMQGIAKLHRNLKGTTDYAYTGLLYQIFQFQPFAGILNTEMNSGVIDVRPARNLAKLTQIIGKYEYLYGIEVLSGKYMNSNTELLFNLYLRLLISGGINEYEDDSEYAPSGCVSFLTIHQAKGMEFPIVITDSLGKKPWSKNDALMQEIERRHFHRKAFEPNDQKKYFDFWRLYYTAFSRAQDLLVLTSSETKDAPSVCFKDLYHPLTGVNDKKFHISEFDFKPVKNVNIKNSYSFTSHIAVYETCPRQYKFYRELEFTSVRNAAVLFGTLVHETIEDIHKAVLKNEEDKITTENITAWFKANYETLSKTEHSYLASKQQTAALNQVLKYVERQKDDWSPIKEAEVDVSLVKPDYIIEGKIDLIKGENDTVEIIDFKSEKKPDPAAAQERLERYRKQLNVYAYLVEQRTGHKVSKLHLYYTGDDTGNPTITFPYTRSDIETTMTSFGNIVHKIINKDFNESASDKKVCENCDFRYYCKTLR